MEKQEATKIMA